MSTLEKPQAIAASSENKEAAKQKPTQKPYRKYYGKKTTPKAQKTAETEVVSQGSESVQQSVKRPAPANKPAAQKGTTTQKQTTSRAAGKQKSPAEASKAAAIKDAAAKEVADKAAAKARPSRQNAAHKTKAAAKDNAIGVNVIPLGGLGEVGKNATVFECQGDMIMVDCGLVFPDDDMFGVDLVIPDFSFVVQNKEKFKGVIITHGHEDHIGALPYLLKQVNLPIYGTRLTLGLIENKLKEHGLLQSTKMNVIRPGEKIHFGCMTVEPIHVNHSIPDAVSFAIDTPAGVVIATGDFKIDYTPISGGVTDLATFAAYGKKGVLALLSDSTNAERPGASRSERTVGASFASLFGKAEKKRIIIATFASSLYRVQQILDMAAQYGRKVAISGRSMVNNTAMAFELGYLKAPEGLIIEMEMIHRYPPESIVILTTGSQGEPLSALSRMAAGLHRSVRIGAGDFIIISATPIPGNEKGVGKVVNGLLMLGADVIYESMYDVHVSGHAYQDEQKLLLSLVQPQFFMPVHGEYKQLIKHAGLAEAIGVAKSNIIMANIGEVWHITKNAAVKESEVQAGRVLVDGLGVGDVGSVVLRDRHHLAQDGLVIVVASIDTNSGELLSGPDLVSRGFVYVREAEQLMADARTEVKNIFNQCQRDGVKDYASVKARVREQLGQFMYRKTKRSPMILPIVMEI